MEYDIRTEIINCNKCNKIDGVMLTKPDAFYGGVKPKVMIIGHSPTVRTSEQADVVLKLDNPNRALYKYINNNILQPLGITINDIYCTNLIKCYTEKLPEDVNSKNKNYIEEITGNCFDLLEKEIESINPQLIISLSGRVFEIIAERYMNKKLKIKNCYGILCNINILGKDIKYIPVVHIPKSKRIKDYYFPEQTNRLQALKGTLCT